MKDFVGRAGGVRPGDRLRVQGHEGGFVFVRRDDAAHGVWSRCWEQCGSVLLFIGPSELQVGTDLCLLAVHM